MTSAINDNEWTILSPDALFRRFHFACGIYKDRYIVIVGGQRYTDTCRSAIYDITTRSHVELPDLPFVGECSGVVLDDYFYAVIYDHKIFRICLSSPVQWESITNDYNIGYDAIVTDDTDIFLICDKNTVSCYDSNTNKLTWTIRNFNSRPCYEYSAVIVDKKIYMIGGRRRHEGTNDDVVIFDTATKSWSQAPPLPKPLSRHAAVVMPS